MWYLRGERKINLPLETHVTSTRDPHTNICKNLEKAAWVGCISGAMRTAKDPPNCASHTASTVINVCSNEQRTIRKHWKWAPDEVDLPSMESTDGNESGLSTKLLATSTIKW